MIPNFEDVKKQLGELVDIVNGFKSEQVQLRVIEAVLAKMGAAAPTAHSPATDAHAQAKPPKGSGGGKSKKPNGGTTQAGKSAGGKKPKKAIEDLLAENYFGQHRQIGDVVSYLKDNRALTFSRGAVQMVLNRLVQDKQMQRAKNAENQQFEYWK